MEDVDMDAPQISTLPEDGSPEPQQTPARTSKFRVKLVLGEGKRPTTSTSSLPKQKDRDSEGDDEDEDEDEEEDQLIDDDEDESAKPPTISIPPTAPAPASTTTASSRGTTSRRGVGRGRGGGRRRGGKADAVTKTPSNSSPLAATAEGWTPNNPVAATTPAAGAIGKKKSAVSRGSVAQRAIRKRGSRVAKGVAVPPRDDAGSISEVAAYAGTAASSPMPHDEHSPEPEAPSGPAATVLPPPVEAEISLEGIPLPVYPLPSKPYPVQPPPKIGTGFAPVVSLDKSGKPVRKWRQANREIRGIAGGRWFTRAWVGDKESEFASAQAAASAALQSATQATLSERDGTSAGLPPLPSVSVPGTGKSTPRGKGAKAIAGLTTGQSSRAASTVPESITAHLPAGKKRVNVPIPTGADTPASMSTPGP